MLIEFLADHGSNKVGEVIDVQATIGRAYVDAGVAKESDTLSAMRSMLKAEQDKANEALKAQLEEVKRGLIPSATSGPPSRGLAFDDRGVPIHGGRIEGTESPADRGSQCLADVMRCIAWQGGMNTPPGLREMANQRLRSVYKFDEVKYEVDEQSGRIFEIRTDGSTGQVYRTGTESMGGGPSYGFLVKPEYYKTLFSVMIEDSIIAPEAMQIPIGQAVELKWPALDQFGTPTAGQSSAYAGVSLYRATEIQQRTASDAKTSMIDFKITDLTGFTSLSRDLLSDAFIAADALIQRIFGMAFAWKTDYEYLNGTGIGQPRGILNSPATLTVTRGTGSHIEYEDIVGMQAKLHPTCWKNAFWVTNVTCIPDLQAIKNHAGNYVYQPNSLVAQGMTPSIMGTRPEGGGERGVTTAGDRFRFQGWLQGLPLKFSEKVPVLGTQGDLMLVSPAMSYGIAMRQGLEVGLSEHFYFDTDRIAFRFKLRNDAQSLWRAPYQQADGSNTQVSPFVVLK